MLLTAGILLWILVHLSGAIQPGLRQSMVARVGAAPYKGLFALLILAALGLIIVGWKAFPPGQLYLPPAGLRHVTMLLMPLAFILFLAARIPTDLKTRIRHPQLTGVKLWAVAHLLSNGETRSVLLFGGMLAWAVLEVVFINRRDGQWNKPAPVGLGRSLLQAAVAVAISVGVVFAHPWLAGVSLIPG